MANIKSQIKRNRQNLKRRLRNRFHRGTARGAVLQARGALDAAEPTSADSVRHAVSLLDKAAERGVLHPNNAARRKGRLMRRLAALGTPGEGASAVLPEAPDGIESGAPREGAKKATGRASTKKTATKKTSAKPTKK